MEPRFPELALSPSSSAARVSARSPFTPGIVAQVLSALGRGLTYRQAASRIDTGGPVDSERSWRLAADWVDAYASPVLAGRLPDRWPAQVMVAWLPLGASAQVDPAGGEPWGLMLAGVRTGEQSGALTAVSVARGTAECWTEFLGSLSGCPRVIVGEPGSQARAAAAALWGQRGPVWVSSHWHVRRSVRMALRRSGPAAAELAAELAGALGGPAAWGRFAALVRSSAPGSPAAGLVDAMSADLLAQLTWLESGQARITSSAALELLAAPFQSALAARRGRFTNLARTRRLVSLMLAHQLQVDDVDAYESVVRGFALDRVPVSALRRASAGQAGLRPGMPGLVLENGAQLSA
jgi:hypothetical protein